MGLILASQIIGFISFSITLLTLLGVYADLLKTFRSAPSTIPLALGNLREEIQYEQTYLEWNLRCGDEFEVFPESGPKQRKRRHEFARLMHETLRHVWREFCNLERSFLIEGQNPWSLHGGKGEDLALELDEKTTDSRRRKSARRPPRRESFVKNRMGMIEAGLSNDRGTYYSTDLFHRFLWWWKADDIKNLADQVQRLQIRRIERDVYESDELVKRLYRMQCRNHGHHSGQRDDSDGNYSSQDDRSGSNGGRGPPHGRAVRERGSSAVNDPRRGRRSRNRSSAGKVTREVYEREIVRSRRKPEDVRSPQSNDASNMDRSRGNSAMYEYEVIDPGRVYVERPRVDQSRYQGRQRSYSRDRD